MIFQIVWHLKTNRSHRVSTKNIVQIRRLKVQKQGDRSPWNPTSLQVKNDEQEQLNKRKSIKYWIERDAFIVWNSRVAIIEHVPISPMWREKTGSAELRLKPARSRLRVILSSFQIMTVSSTQKQPRSASCPTTTGCDPHASRHNSRTKKRLKFSAQRCCSNKQASHKPCGPKSQTRKRSENWQKIDKKGAEAYTPTDEDRYRRIEIGDLEVQAAVDGLTWRRHDSDENKDSTGACSDSDQKNS